MKLPKAVLGAVLVGLAVQTTSCIKKDEVKPNGEKTGQKGGKTIDSCPACGMG
ncbi:hypothetical protein [Hymenobacter gummosus]|uniref:chryseobasin-related MNIO class RiPP peptide n=1 Tax=Hymenobacter gummosus TaxID=1776032 RepID=UPI0014045858|nr:hypothetical protein [Hymenobacter gummosus]